MMFPQNPDYPLVQGGDIILAIVARFHKLFVVATLVAFAARQSVFRTIASSLARICHENRFSCFVVKIYFHEDYLDNVRLNGCSKILLYLLTGQGFMGKKSCTKRKYEFFCGVLCQKRAEPKAGAKLHGRGKHPIFMLPAAKSRWLIFKKKMGLLTSARHYNYANM